MSSFAPSISLAASQDAAKRVVIDGVAIAVVKDSNGDVHAIGDTCTHGDISLSDGFVEGVYLRIDDAAHCVARGKCVRPDFIQGIEEHWMAGGLVKNAVALGGADEEV